MCCHLLFTYVLFTDLQFTYLLFIDLLFTYVLSTNFLFTDLLFTYVLFTTDFMFTLPGEEDQDAYDISRLQKPTYMTFMKLHYRSQYNFANFVIIIIICHGIINFGTFPMCLQCI